MIEVKDLHKAFGAVRAVDGVSFAARDGQITGLLGPNGAGKTTTLRMLYTLMAPDSGQVLVDGIDAAVDPVGHVGTDVVAEQVERWVGEDHRGDISVALEPDRWFS